MKPLSIPVWSIGVWVVRAMLLENVERVFEGEPLADAEMELAFLLHLLEYEEVFPVAVILHAGDTVGEGIVDGEFVGFAAFLHRGRGDDLFHDALRGCDGDVAVDAIEENG